MTKSILQNNPQSLGILEDSQKYKYTVQNMFRSTIKYNRQMQSDAHLWNDWITT